MGTDSLRFAASARAIAEAARRLGLVAPGFRSPPRLAGVDRSLRRRSGAPAAVAVRLAGRRHRDVVADMVEGVVVVNRLVGERADVARAALLEAVEAVEVPARAQEAAA